MNLMLIIGVLAVLVGIWCLIRRRVEVPCELDLEATQEHFHAHAVLHDVVVQEGDRVLLHGAPDRIHLGERRRLTTSATVAHASAPRRLLARLLGTTGITELYDVGFEG